MAPPEAHTMPATDQATARRQLKLKPGDPLPKEFVVLYWAHRHLKCRSTANPCQPDVIALLLVMAGLKAEPPPPATLFELWRDRKIRKGTKVAYVRRNPKAKGDEPKIEQCAGTLSGVDPAHDKMQVRDGVTGKTRWVAAADVSIGEPKPAEPAGA